MEAVEDVKKGISISEASKQHKVPRKTLNDYVREKPVELKSMGAPKMLTDEEETAIIENILYMSDWGLPLTRDHIRTTICVSVNIHIMSHS